MMTRNQTLETNRRYASPLNAGQQFGRAVPAPQSQSVAFAHLGRLIMRIALFSNIASLLTGCATTPEASVTPPAPRVVASDPVERLVARLSSSHGLWQNGLFPKLDLPATASTKQVVSRVFPMTGFDKGHVAEHRILETRQVRIPGSLPDSYTAVLVDTDFGRKILLLKHEGPAVGWWSRVYDAERSG
jgi:hypothetical protein